MEERTVHGRHRYTRRDRRVEEMGETMEETMDEMTEEMDLYRSADTINELLARYGVKFGIYKNHQFK